MVTAMSDDHREVIVMCGGQEIARSCRAVRVEEFLAAAPIVGPFKGEPGTGQY
jgi:hypothetical protein